MAEEMDECESMYVFMAVLVFLWMGKGLGQIICFGDSCDGVYRNSEMALWKALWYV